MTVGLVHVSGRVVVFERGRATEVKTWVLFSNVYQPQRNPSGGEDSVVVPPTTAHSKKQRSKRLTVCARETKKMLNKPTLEVR